MTKKQKERNSKLAAALRSGEYKRTRHILYDEEEDGYCCLGVACRLLDEEGAFSDELDGSSWLDFDFFRPPDCIVDFYGWNFKDPTIVIGNQPASAAYFNDCVVDGSYKYSWDEIAEAFERMVK